MPVVDLIAEVPLYDSVRVRQLSGMFDVPLGQKLRREWHAEVPLDEAPWSVGLIVGPSGSGKSLVARELFGPLVDHKLEWAPDKAVVDCFNRNLSVREITDACSAVGFNTIPSWLKPFRVLSNGEQFRVDLARRLLEVPSPVVVDEFTSVVDRQVAKIASHAVQKYARRSDTRFVAISCHDDIIDWLQPDWIFRPDEGSFHRRRLRRRPEIECTIQQVHHRTWKMFAPFHYMSSEMNKLARCFCLFIEGKPVSFVAFLASPISHGKNKGTAIRRVTRAVTLPDWQGLGLTFVLSENIAAMYKALGHRVRHNPAHPSFVRAFQRSPRWKSIVKYGTFVTRNLTGTLTSKKGAMGGRANAIFEWVGPAFPDAAVAKAVLEGAPGAEHNLAIGAP